MNCADSFLSNEQLLEVFSLTPSATAIHITEDAIIQTASDSMLNIWGKDKSVIGKTLADALPELRGQPFLDMFKRVWNEGITISGSDTPADLKIDGILKTFYFDFEYRAIKNESGKTYCILHTATDITERYLSQQREKKLLEELSAYNQELTAINEELTSSNEELAAINEELSVTTEELGESQLLLRNLNRDLALSEQRFRTMIDQAPVAIAILKGRSLIVELANEEMLHIWGKNNKVIGQRLPDALPELLGQAFLQILDDVFTSGAAYYGSEAQVELEHKGHLEIHYVNFVYEPLKNTEGVTYAIMVVANDVTEQVTSRLALKQKHEELGIVAQQLEFVNNFIPQQVWTATPDGLLDFVNEQTVQYFGKEPKDLIGEKWLEVVHPMDIEAAGKAWTHSLQTGDPYQIEFRLLAKEGNYVYHLARAIPSFNNGKIVKWFGTNTDIDSQKQLEQHKNDFISIASHELKTPITSLRASLQLLNRMKDNPSSPMLAKLIEQSNKGMQKIITLVDDLLSVGRMNEGQIPLNKTCFSLGKLLESSCYHLRVEGAHEFIFEGNMHLQVVADEHLIEQVVVNFVNNAAKYAQGSKEIRLCLEENDNKVKVSVKDNGPGIATDKLPHVFDRYYRADHAGQQYSGLGLGLFICAEIIKRHDGKIGVDSEIGKGSTFWFTLPLN